MTTRLILSLTFLLAVWMPQVLVAQETGRLEHVGDLRWSGTWKGVIVDNGVPWSKVSLEITVLREGLINAYYSLPDLMILGESVSAVSSKGLHLHVVDDDAQLEFAGELDTTRGTIIGTWTQDGRRMSARLRRINAAGRPQEPLGAVPYLRRPLRIVDRDEDIILDGELVLPDSIRRHPVVILISDVGGQDRDGSHHDHRPFLVLADHLARAGWASLRMDDRGVGRSTGTQVGTSTTQFAHDVVLLIDRLRDLPEIDASNITLLAVGEGGMVAAMAALKRPVLNIILLSTSMMDGPTVLRDAFDATEAERGTPDSVRQVYRDMLASWMAALRFATSDAEAARRIAQIADSIHVSHGKDLTSYPALGPAVADDRDATITTSIIPWLRRYDAMQIAAVLRPRSNAVHVVLGERDPVVPVRSNADAARQLTGRDPVVIKNANHYLQTCERCTADESVTLDETLAPTVLEAVIDILRKGRR